jgi:hypothetical protein
MANKKYPSKYSNGKLVSAAQYITEIICENRAKMLKKDLHYRFWVSKEWASYYRNQIGTANKLLEKYSDTAIIKALNNSKASKIYSLRAPHLLPIIEHEEEIVQSQNKIFTKEIERLENPKFQSVNIGIKKNNILSKLKDIDNES